MSEVLTINNTELTVKEWDSQRVVTFKDIDEVHNRPEGTAKRNFQENKEKFILGEDYFIISQRDLEDKNASEASNSLKYEFRPSINKDDVNTRGTTFLTESGYLMLVKSLNDDTAWDVQRKLVNTYFKTKEVFAITEKQYNELLDNYNKLKDQLNTLFIQLGTNGENIDKLDCRVACIESGTSVSGGRLSPWVKDMSSKVMELADYYENTVKKMYSVIIARMENKFGIFFQHYFDEYVANHPNEKPVWRIVVIEYYDLKDLFESAYKDLAKEIGLYLDNKVDSYYDF